MIYKFRVFSDINEKFLRCIEIDEEDTFLSLHEAVRTSVNFNKMEMASFYLSNDLWDRLTQITLMDVQDGEADDIFTMEQTSLNEFLSEEGENLVYVYDFISDRVFYLVLSEIKNRNASLKYPLCSQTIGDPPVQTIGEKRILKGVVAGKVITNIKKTTSLASQKTLKPADKIVKDAKNDLASKAKKVDASKTAKSSKEDAKSLVKGKVVEKSKTKLVEDKKASKVVASAKNVSKTKKGKSFDEDEDLDIDDDELEETPAKGKVAKKAAKPSRSRSVDDDDDDLDDDDDSDDDDEDLVDDSGDDAEEEEDFGFDEDDFEKKFKSESVFNEFDEDDFDDQMFDNIDDYADRI